MTTAKTETAAKGKKLNVQVPGDTTAKTETAGEQASNQGAKPEVTMADVGLEAEAPKGHPNYRQMHAKDIDATKLAAPVLSLDGWVCPSK